jgi:predicted metal-dependent phosphoesterase TrpH/glycosyltransferase involved in cell wall biosynthesis
MGLRVCMVTPFAWSQPHPVNDHVAGAAAALAARGHDVVVLAPSTRTAELVAGRRALRRLERDGVPLSGVVALGTAVPVSRASRLGVPVGVRANLALALAADRFDVVHVHDPGLPSLSYLALRRTDALTVATFHSPERLSYPPGKQAREKLLGRIDALTAVGADTLARARERFPGDYELLPAGVDVEQTAPRPAKRLVVEWRADERLRARAALRALDRLPGWELVLLRTTVPAARPTVPRRVRDRVHVVTALDRASRQAALSGAAALVPATAGAPRLRAEAAGLGVPALDPPGAARQPELVAAAVERVAEDPAWRDALAQAARMEAAAESFDALAERLQRVYGSVTRRRRTTTRHADPLGDRPFVVADLHMHTEHSHDCSIPVADLLDHAEEIGLGAIAVTDHNVFAGAREAVELARGRRLVVIPGEEVKTDLGEVIGLFLDEEIPPGMSMGETIAAIRDQGGLVYLPHPFDRLHTIPDARTLRSHLAEIDVLEVYNARLLFEGYNDEALRYARKYNLLMGAGSDAHVLQGLGTGAVRMRAFETPEEFVLALRSAEILRRPKSLVYLQGLKWVAQARERRARAVAG